MTNAIGGYFELELRKGEHYHKNAIRLNSGRNCFEYILRARGYKRVYMPFYTCEVLYEPLRRTGVERIDYRINEQLEPIALPDLKEGEAFLYTNYYGLKQICVEHLAQKYGNRLIVDNAQAFYADPIEGIDTFYSPRKFFGVSDGGYLYTDSLLEGDFKQAKSMQRMSHLLKRIEDGAEVGYADYQKEEATLVNRPIERMSKLTDALLGTIDYEKIAQERVTNYRILDEQLGQSNVIHFEMRQGNVPMAYLYLTSDENLRSKLIKNKVFVATYWPNINNDNSYETYLKHHLLPLPIDQRYNEDVMNQVINLIHNNIYECKN